jgi:putative acetyltransferase
MKLREEVSGDQQAIRTVVANAFGSCQEAKLVDDLRKDGDLAVSIVVEEDGEIRGYIALSRLKSPERGLALAPLAVSTKAQRRGIGSALIREALSRAQASGTDIVFVVGDPNYYSRFGFSADVALPFPCPYSGPYFMGLWLSDVQSKPTPVIYPAAFARLE